jgi:hypothetical protein
MRFLVDLRYVVPPLLILGKPWAQDHSLNNEIFVMACLSLAIATLLFLFTSVKLPLSVEPLHLSAGHFSAPLTLSLLASIFFPTPLFWFAFSMLLILSPWYELVLDALKQCLLWVCHNLQAIPSFFIICITQRPPVELEAVEME